MNNFAPRAALAGCFILIPLQITAAEPNVSFLCASEQVVYHMYFSHNNKWEFSIDKDKSAYVIKNDRSRNPAKWIVISERERKNLNPFVEYVCSDGGTGSYLICDGNNREYYDKFHFNFITQKFDKINYRLDWVSESKGHAMIYQFGACEKQSD